MKIIHKKAELKALIKKQTGSIGLVPTMGALHAGHKSLIDKAVSENDFVVVSVFVNPVQFAPNEDYDKYPRTLDKDAILVQNSGADVIFAPAPDEMYTDIYFKEKETTLVCAPYKYVNRLCGKSRPGHFDGVCTVVSKLFNLVHPNKAYFGEKDAQQLFIIKKMVEELDFDIEIVPCPIVRENDGLAISSRNSYLSEYDRKIAVNISLALKKAKELYASGIKDSQVLIDTVFSYLKEFDVDYIQIVSKEDFCPIIKADKPPVMLIAAKTPENHVRLIDNMEL
ncbi:MAG: pantoate--beta-alanine ligase [Candidatus Gastranaerophilales bacterium]|nr:pantoate--beta-alanine ligase [Candidatus Gastranaerophilales bacterium]